MPQQYSPEGTDNEFTIPAFPDVLDGETAFRDFAGSIDSPPAPGSRGVRQTFVSPNDPDNALGADGDVWLKYV